MCRFAGTDFLGGFTGKPSGKTRNPIWGGGGGGVSSEKRQPALGIISESEHPRPLAVLGGLQLAMAQRELLGGSRLHGCGCQNCFGIPCCESQPLRGQSWAAGFLTPLLRFSNLPADFGGFRWADG